MTIFLQAVVDAISLGAFYALLALGIALVFGIMRLVNFAHGEFIMVGGYTLFLLSGQLLAVMIMLTIIVVVALAVATERIAIRPVRGADAATLMITSYAISYLLQNIALLTAGGLPKSVTLSTFLIESINVGGVTLRAIDLVTIATTAVLAGVLALFLKRT